MREATEKDEVKVNPDVVEAVRDTEENFQPLLSERNVSKIEPAKVSFEQSVDGATIKANDGRCFAKGDNDQWTMTYRANGQDKQVAISNVELKDAKLSYDLPASGKLIRVTENPDGTRLAVPLAEQSVGATPGDKSLLLQKNSTENKGQNDKGYLVAQKDDKALASDKAEKSKDQAAEKAAEENRKVEKDYLGRVKKETEALPGGGRKEVAYNYAPQPGKDGKYAFVKVESVYDANNKQLSETANYPDGSKSRTEYKYADGKLAEKSFTRTTAKMDESADNIKDPRYRQLSQEYARAYNKQNPVVETKEVTKYSYDKNGELQRSESISTRGGKETGKTIEERQSDGSMKEDRTSGSERFVKVTKDGVIQSKESYKDGALRYDYTLNKDGSTVERNFEMLDGKHRQTSQTDSNPKTGETHRREWSYGNDRAVLVKETITDKYSRFDIGYDEKTGEKTSTYYEKGGKALRQTYEGKLVTSRTEIVNGEKIQDCQYTYDKEKNEAIVKDLINNRECRISLEKPADSLPTDTEHGGLWDRTKDAVSDPGKVYNKSDKPIVVIVNGHVDPDDSFQVKKNKGSNYVYVIQPGEEIPKDVDIDGVVMDRRYQAVKGPDGVWRAPIIPAGDPEPDIVKVENNNTVNVVGFDSHNQPKIEGKYIRKSGLHSEFGGGQPLRPEPSGLRQRNSQWRNPPPVENF